MILFYYVFHCVMATIFILLLIALSSINAAYSRHIGEANSNYKLRISKYVNVHNEVSIETANISLRNVEENVHKLDIAQDISTSTKGSTSNDERRNEDNSFHRDLVNEVRNALPSILSKIKVQNITPYQSKQLFGGKLPPFLERIVQRFQNYFSVYNPPEYFEHSRPHHVSNAEIAPSPSCSKFNKTCAEPTTNAPTPTPHSSAPPSFFTELDICEEEQEGEDNSNGLELQNVSAVRPPSGCEDCQENVLEGDCELEEIASTNSPPAASNNATQDEDSTLPTVEDNKIKTRADLDMVMSQAMIDNNLVNVYSPADLTESSFRNVIIILEPTSLQYSPYSSVGVTSDNNTKREFQKQPGKFYVYTSYNRTSNVKPTAEPETWEATPPPTNNKFYVHPSFNRTRTITSSQSPEETDKNEAETTEDSVVMGVTTPEMEPFPQFNNVSYSVMVLDDKIVEYTNNIAYENEQKILNSTSPKHKKCIPRLPKPTIVLTTASISSNTTCKSGKNCTTNSTNSAKTTPYIPITEQTLLASKKPATKPTTGAPSNNKTRSSEDNTVPSFNLVLLPLETFEAQLRNRSSNCNTIKQQLAKPLNPNLEYFVLRPNFNSSQGKNKTDEKREDKNKGKNKNSTTKPNKKPASKHQGVSFSYLPPNKGGHGSSKEDQFAESASSNDAFPLLHKFPLLYRLFNGRHEEPRNRR